MQLCAEQASRFHAKQRHLPVDGHVRSYIESRGSDTLLERIHGHFTAYLDERPLARRLVTDGQDQEATYAALLAACH